MQSTLPVGEIKSDWMLTQTVFAQHDKELLMKGSRNYEPRNTKKPFARGVEL